MKNNLGMTKDHIASCGYSEMIIHVAEWNQNAVQMYKNEVFEIV